MPRLALTGPMAAVLLSSLVAGPPPAAAGQAGRPAASPAPAPAASPAVVAIVAGEPLTAADLEKAAGARLFQLRSQQYQAERQILEETIGERLLEKEAAARKVTVEELLKQEVDAKVTPTTEAEIKGVYEQNKARIGAMPEADALARIGQSLRQQRWRERQSQYLDLLRSQAGVRVLLSPPRLAVETGDNPSRGPADAPITIVEFSDFQCPYCSRALPTLKRLEEAYPGKIRLVYRDFPLVEIHPQAARAAEAATCAHEQGKFWPMHDAIFANPTELGDADLKKHAAGASLDAARFAECLDSGRHASEWRKDQEAAVLYGVQSTPAFFINGRLVLGAQPYENFARVVEEELALAGAR